MAFIKTYRTFSSSAQEIAKVINKLLLKKKRLHVTIGSDLRVFENLHCDVNQYGMEGIYLYIHVRLSVDCDL